MEKSFGDLLRKLDGPILVTGHTGFKGTWLTRYLQILGVDVVGYSLEPQGHSLYSMAGLKGQISEQFGDINDFSKLSHFVNKTKPSAILHLAAQALVSESYLDPIGTFRTNVLGTANILQIAKDSEWIKAVGVVTTDKVYMNKNLGNRFKENDPILGTDPYSASKAACENVIEAWRKIDNRHFPIISLRAGNVIGGGDLSKNRLIPDLVRGFQNSVEVLVRNPYSTRPWQHVLDPLTGYLLALERALLSNEHATYNFGPGEDSLSVNEVVEVFRRNWSKLEISVAHNSNQMYESIHLDLDSSLARDQLKWTPKLNQVEAIEKTIEWWEDFQIHGLSSIDCTDIQIKNFLA